MNSKDDGLCTNDYGFYPENDDLSWQAHRSAVKGMAVYSAEIAPGDGARLHPRSGNCGGKFQKLATVGANGSFHSWYPTECVSQTIDLQTRARRANEGVYGGCPVEIYHGTQAKHAFGRRISTGDKTVDATPVKMWAVLHVYDLGTDNVGSSLLQKVNGHALGAFHTALEIGWPHEHGSTEFPGAISVPTLT